MCCPKAYYINLLLDNRYIPALIDTGATVSVVRGDILDRFPILKDKFIESDKSCYVLGVGGNRVAVRGNVTCSFALPNFEFRPHKFRVISEVSCSPIILGVDFLHSNKMIIDMASNRLQMKDCLGGEIELPLSVEERGEQSAVCLARNEILKPNECTLVKLKLDSGVSGEGFAEPLSFQNRSWKLANTLSEPVDCYCWGQIINVSGESIHLQAGSRVGTWQAVDYVVNTVEGCSDVEELYSKLQLNDLDIEPVKLKVLKDLIGQYKDVFGRDNYDLGYCKTITHNIDTGDHPPIRQRYRRLHPPLKDLVSEELSRMEKQGIIAKSSSPWCSPLVPVKKKNGKIRICIDYRRLNSVTKLNSYPLPNIEDRISQFADTEFFSTLDLLSGYHQVALDEESREKTAFATDEGLFEYRVMPQGACNSPATFQNLMNVVLQGVSSRQASAYLDDVLVTGRTFDEHLRNLEEVLKRLRRHGLKLSTDKCNLLKSSVPYLGHVLTRSGVKTAPHNVKAILELPIPKTVREVKKLNGMVNYYSRFVPGIATIMAPLYAITKEKRLNWTVDCNKAFQIVKDILTSDPILAYPRFGRDDSFIISTDASDVGVGAVLSQEQNGIEKVLGYASVALNKAQKRYSTTEKELAALRFGVRHFKTYIYGRKYIVRTDHRALIYLNQMKNVDNRLMRTFEDLQVGDYHLEYIKGTENYGADILSRNPLGSDLLEGDLEEADTDLGEFGEVVFVAPGGPNSLFECLSEAKTECIAPLELRKELVSLLVNNMKTYGLENKSKCRKLIESYSQEDVFTGNCLIQPFVDLYSCDVIVCYRGGPRLVFKNKRSKTFIVLECWGGVHFNVLQMQRDLEHLNVVEVVGNEAEIVHEITDDTDERGNIEYVRELYKLDDDLPYNDETLGENDELTSEEAELMVLQVHEDLHHPGIAKTLHTCKKKMKIKVSKLSKIVKKCIKECDVCQRYKVPKQSKHQAPPMYNLKPSRTGEVIALDLLDLGPRTSERNKVLLVGVDLYSKFGYAVPLKSKTSGAVARALECFIFSNAVHIPKCVLTDNGPEFRGAAFKDILTKFNVEHKNSIAYHPRSNGAVERLNRTIKERLATTVDGDYKRWDKVIISIMVQYNRTVHQESGKAPVSFYTNFEEEPVLREPLKFRLEPGKNFKPLLVGDLVLRKIPFKTKEQKHKLSPIFDGPYEIIEKLSEVSYRLKLAGQRSRSYLVHISQIKPYFPSTHRARVFSNRNRKSTVRRTVESDEVWIPPPLPPDPVIVNSGTYTMPEIRDTEHIALDRNPINEDISEGLPIGCRPRLVSTPNGGDPPAFGLTYGSDCYDISEEVFRDRPSGIGLEGYGRDLDGDKSGEEIISGDVENVSHGEDIHEVVSGEEQVVVGGTMGVSGVGHLAGAEQKRRVDLLKDIAKLSADCGRLLNYEGMTTRSRARQQTAVLESQQNTQKRYEGMMTRSRARRQGGVGGEAAVLDTPISENEQTDNINSADEVCRSPTNGNRSTILRDILGTVDECRKKLDDILDDSDISELRTSLDICKEVLVRSVDSLENPDIPPSFRNLELSRRSDSFEQLDADQDTHKRVAEILQRSSDISPMTFLEDWEMSMDTQDLDSSQELEANNIDELSGNKRVQVSGVKDKHCKLC